MGNTIDDSRNKELHGKKSYISEDGKEGSIRHFGSDSINEKGIEEDIVEGDEEVNVKENLERNKEDYYQGNVHGNDDAVYGNGMRRTNLNIMGRCRFEQ